MPGKERILSVLFSVLLLINVLVIFAPPRIIPLASAETGGPTQGEGTYENLTGNWTINATDTVYYGNRTLNLTGNLTVHGKLTLQNVTLRFNSTYDGQHGIYVERGGSLVIRDNDNDRKTVEDGCNITAVNMSNAFIFKVKAGSNFTMNNSQLHYCGYEFRDNGEMSGLWINANWSFVKGNIITNSMLGITLHNVINSKVENNYIYNCYGEKGISGGASDPGGEGKPAMGIFLKNTTQCNISDNTITNIFGGEGGIGTRGGRGSNSYGIYSSSSPNNNISYNKISLIYGGIGGRNTDFPGYGPEGKGIGIYIYNSSLTVIRSNNCSYNMTRGISIDVSNQTILINNDCSLNRRSGIRLLHSYNNRIINNRCNLNGMYGIVLQRSNGTISNNRCNLNSHNDIYLSRYCNYSVLSNNIANTIVLSSDSNNNTIFNNTCNFGGGIALFASSGNLIKDNKCLNNTQGIFPGNAHWNHTIHYSSQNIIINNILSSNNYGLFVNSLDNIISNNIISWKGPGHR